MKLKKLVFIIVTVMTTMVSYGATAADYSDIVYAKDVKASLGGTVEVPIYLKNPDYAVKSLQFSMELPDGVSFVEVENVGHKYTANDLTQNWTISFRTKNGEAANTGLAMMSYQNDATTTIASGDQEVFTITLQVDANTTAGSKSIVMKEITLTDGNGTEQTILSGSQSITSYVNIQRADVIEEMSNGYSLELAPFTPKEGISTLTLQLKASTTLKDIQFDIELPQGIMFYGDDTDFNTSTATLASGVTTKTPSSSLTIAEGYDTYMNKATVKFTGSNTGAVATRKYFNVQNELTTIATIPVYIVPSEQIGDWGDDYALKDGLHEIKLTNIILTDYSAGSTISSGSYYVSILSGTPTDKDPIIYGDITDASNVTPAIPSDATSVDITAATASNDVVDAIAEDIATKNANAVVYAPSTYTGKKNNVVVPDDNGVMTCKNLTVTDGVAFSIPASFTATNASYSRTMSNTWGTICLPYAVTSDANVAYYKITGLNAGVLSIEQYDELPAGTPALVKKLSGSEIAPSATSVAVGGELNNVTGSVNMYGSYTNNVRVEDANSYYIYNNKFYNCNEYFICNAFRAYFTVEGGSAKVLTIGDDIVTAIDTLTNNEVEAVYDANGIRHSDIQKGMNIVKLANGKTQKIMVK